MRGTMLAASTGRGKLAFDLGKAARPVGDNIQLRRLALCPVELRARCSASTLTLVATLRARISCSRMHSYALERASARGRPEEHEARGPLVDASGHAGELGDEAEVCGGGLLRGMDGKHQMFISLQLSDSRRSGAP